MRSAGWSRSSAWPESAADGATLAYGTKSADADRRVVHGAKVVAGEPAARREGETDGPFAERCPRDQVIRQRVGREHRLDDLLAQHPHLRPRDQRHGHQAFAHPPEEFVEQHRQPDDAHPPAEHAADGAHGRVEAELGRPENGDGAPVEPAVDQRGDEDVDQVLDPERADPAFADADVDGDVNSARLRWSRKWSPEP